MKAHIAPMQQSFHIIGFQKKNFPVIGIFFFRSVFHIIFIICFFFHFSCFIIKNLFSVFPSLFIMNQMYYILIFTIYYEFAVKLAVHIIGTHLNIFIFQFYSLSVQLSVFPYFFSSEVFIFIIKIPNPCFQILFIHSCM